MDGEFADLPGQGQQIVTGGVGCGCSSSLALNGSSESFWGAGCQDHDLVRRLEVLAEHRFGEVMAPASTLQRRSHEAGGDFFMLEFEVKDTIYSNPKRSREEGSV